METYVRDKRRRDVAGVVLGPRGMPANQQARRAGTEPDNNGSSPVPWTVCRGRYDGCEKSHEPPGGRDLPGGNATGPDAERRKDYQSTVALYLRPL